MSGTVCLELEFIPNPCANPECKVPTLWWIIGGALAQTVCPLCYALVNNLCHDAYWVELQTAELSAAEQDRKRIDRLRFGGDYFPE